MRVLVTGASGLLGRAAARRLIDRGDEVTVLQRRSAGLPCREVRGDVADPAVAARALRGQDAVLHLAAKVDVTGRWADYASANVDGTRALLAGCRTAGVGRFVYVSSPSVAHAGAALAGVGAEPADPARTRGHYSRSKAIAEREALAADAPSLAVLAVRPHLVWGPGDTQLVARVVARARAGRLPVIGSGAALIDTTYVDNAAGALVAGVDACGPVHGEALVVSNGEPRPVGEVLARLCRAAGVPGPRGRVPFPAAWLAGALAEGAWSVTRRRSTPPLTRFLAEQLATAHWFDQRRTRAALGWRPEVGLDEGFSRLAAWYGSAPVGDGRPG
ncbi:NAD-dependent epimerase/dehydratase family protein [Geodermatophilus sabuli]|uniref:Nucleoside-diphosphate-sugar epimerase n=1 Tax=Geodermatophilus sabuli TaxID=1564158 RepID=A0A285EDW3_9ACTN|nr:NAD-dependent epimerase/dehydratase family protein [Geodermatophilus sabuli]MBB3084336.1 nucleoside-diphosphate-sugar epimerase [Geodermatophilus sabuli]SNX96394.1 Nucleoside-diphosphate-sugar epimerase [Geodermatophilus sabuli]